MLVRIASPMLYDECLIQKIEPRLGPKTPACSHTSLEIHVLRPGQRNSVFTAHYGVCSYSLIFNSLLVQTTLHWPQKASEKTAWPGSGRALGPYWAWATRRDANSEAVHQRPLSGLVHVAISDVSRDCLLRLAHTALLCSQTGHESICWPVSTFTILESCIAWLLPYCQSVRRRMLAHTICRIPSISSLWACCLGPKEADGPGVEGDCTWWKRLSWWWLSWHLSLA